MFHSSLYEKPRYVTDLAECHFYHTMEIPGYGLVSSQWDLRNGIREYTGGIAFAGKRVLEIGTASGFVCFFMEREGADVVAYDLSDNFDWDVVPIAGLEYSKLLTDRRSAIRKLNNGYWLAHRAFGSNAKVVYGTVYDIPSAIGPVDVATLCAVLHHVRDPFRALWNASRLTRETILVTESLSPYPQAVAVNVPHGIPVVQFIPNTERHDAWWYLTPATVKRFLSVLGFDKAEISFHQQESSEGTHSMFSVVAHRTAGAPQTP
ncbi:MAG: methyltransferase domain-containing protein [Candidatus Eremiobacteraeota bacterium]|nr:methyltransferase domain-containing protein [Candidatus Eremiobacteraeota bacterium]